MGSVRERVDLIVLKCPDDWQHTNIILNMWAFIFSSLLGIHIVLIVIFLCSAL